MIGLPANDEYRQHPTDAQLAIAVFSSLRAHELVAVLEQVCEQRGVLLHEICGRTRHRSTSYARHELWWRIKHHPGRHYSSAEIARMFRRDRASVRYGIRAHETRRTA